MHPILHLLMQLLQGSQQPTQASPQVSKHRPVPEFPQSGFLGVQPLPDGSYATELNTTYPHPTIFGKWTNSPLLVPGQIGTDTLMTQNPNVWPSQEQMQRASDFAAFLQNMGYNRLPQFNSAEEADQGAVHRHKQFER